MLYEPQGALSPVALVTRQQPPRRSLTLAAFAFTFARPVSFLRVCVSHLLTLAFIRPNMLAFLCRRNVVDPTPTRQLPGLVA